MRSIASSMIELEQKFNELYEANADSVFRMCLFKTSNREVALDLSQDIFTRVWGYLVDGNEVENLRAFLFTVARNRIKDYYKKKKTFSFTNAGIEDEEELLPSDSVTSDRAEHLELISIIQKLPPQHAELIQLRYIEGLPIEEIALIYNARPNTLSVKIHRILKSIREEL